MNTKKRLESEIFSTSLDTERVMREVSLFKIRYAVDEASIFYKNLSLETFREEATRTMVLQLSARIASKKFESRTVIFPADWWQSFKKRWLPAWALKKWPVEHTQITFEASAYHPDIEIPDRATFVEIIHRTQERMFR